MGCRDDLMYLTVHDLIERFIAADKANGDYVRQIHALQSELRAAQDSLAKLEAKPMFEFGKCYLNRRGNLCGPLVANPDSNWNGTHPLKDQDGYSYTIDGIVCGDRRTPTDLDLLPGAVDRSPTWTPPASLPDGEYVADAVDGLRTRGGWLTTESLRRWFNDYTQPATGLWQVTDGKATYLGEA